VVERVRSNPKLAVAIALGVLVVIAWIAWAARAGSEHGSRAAVGVLIAWPLLLIAAALIVFACIGVYRLIRGVSSSADAGDSADLVEDEPGDEEVRDEAAAQDEGSGDEEVRDEAVAQDEGSGDEEAQEEGATGDGKGGEEEGEDSESGSKPEASAAG
jgi:hypothetical protein